MTPTLDHPCVTVLSLGAGVQSSALLLMSDRGEVERADFAVFADTQSEPASVYDWLNYIESKVSIPVIRTTIGNLMTDAMDQSRRFASIPYHVKNPDGTAGIGRRQCTADYKLKPIYRAVRERIGYAKGARVKHKVRMLIGISCDEVYRMKPSRVSYVENVYPLIDLWHSRQKCIATVKGYLDRTPPRSACIICPYHSDAEWLSLKRNEPAEFQRAIDFDAAIRKQTKWKGENYVHRSLKPLSEVVFKEADANQPDLFNNECEGMCGV